MAKFEWCVNLEGNPEVIPAIRLIEVKILNDYLCAACAGRFKSDVSL